MKGKRQEQAERRRALVEINLSSHGRSRGGKSRSTAKRRGCAQLFVLALALGSALTLWVGLH